MQASDADLAYNILLFSNWFLACYYPSGLASDNFTLSSKPLKISVDVYAHMIHINTYENNIKHR
jgi:hypothetical protein